MLTRKYQSDILTKLSLLSGAPLKNQQWNVSKKLLTWWNLSDKISSVARQKSRKQKSEDVPRVKHSEQRNGVRRASHILQKQNAAASTFRRSEMW